MARRVREGTQRERAWLRALIRGYAAQEDSCLYGLFGHLAGECELPKQEFGRLFEKLYRRSASVFRDRSEYLHKRLIEVATERDQLLDRLQRSLDDGRAHAPSGLWRSGPPPGRGQWWIYWHHLDGTWHVEACEVSPALTQYHDPDARLLLKMQHGVAYPFDSAKAQITHHSPMGPPAPPSVKEEPGG